MAESRLVVFALENEEYGLPIEQVQEIMRLGDIRTIPDTPDYIQGLINIRGQAIPLVNLHIRFDIHTRLVDTEINDETKEKTEDEFEENSYALITEYEGHLVALSVDEVREVISVDNIDECPQMVHVPYISGIVNLPNRIIMKLDLELMLKDSGMEKVISAN